VFAGTDGNVTMAVAVGFIAGPGTFQIGPVGQPTNALITEASGHGWHAQSTIGSGSVTIASITATTAKGTFSFTAPAVDGTGATGTKVVTEGTFDLKFQ
jgi:hypothetical protein